MSTLMDIWFENMVNNIDKTGIPGIESSSVILGQNQVLSIFLFINHNNVELGRNQNGRYTETTKLQFKSILKMENGKI